MAIDFPASPTNGQTYVFNGVTYTYDGTKWTAETGSVSLDKIEEGNTSAEVIDTGSDGRFVVTTEGSERARVDSAGRLLVGTSSARSNLVFGSQIQLEGTQLGNRSLAVVSSSSSGVRGGVLVLAHQKSGTLGGNTALASGDSQGIISFEGSDGTNFLEGARIEALADAGVSTGDLPTRLAFFTTADGASSPTEHARINQAGAFKATTNGTYNNSSNSAHEFYQHNAADAFRVFSVNASLVNDVVQIRTSRNTSNASYHPFNVYNDGAGAYRLRIADSGDVTNTNNSYTGLSDIKLKENVADASSQWTDIKALQVRNYNFKEETGQPTHRQIGLIAQEVELVSPGLVKETIDRDEDGNDLGTVTKSVSYSVLYMKAVKALQEAMARIETLEAANADLAARITALEAN